MAGALMTTVYRALIDWDNDGDFDAGGEDVTARTYTNPGITIHRGRDQIRSLAPPAAGACDFEIDNTSGDYSPENAFGPLVDDLLPGRLVRVTAGTDLLTYNAPGVPYNQIGRPYNTRTVALFTGLLDDLPQHPELARRTVSVPAMGRLSQLAGAFVSTPLYQNITTDAALGYLLDAVGVPVADRVLSVGQTILAWWWLAEEDAFQAALALLNSEGPGASLYEDGDGRIVFEDRNYRLTAPRCVTSQTIFYSAGYRTEPVLTPPIGYNPRLQDIINVATAEHRTRAIAALSVVWTLGAALTLAPNETRLIRARSASGDPFTGALTPVLGTDFTVSAGALTACSLDRTSGASVTIAMTAGPAGATVNGLQLRAQLVSVTTRAQVTSTVDASDSIARYGRRPYTAPLRAEMNINVLQDLVNVIVTAYQEPRAIVELQIIAATPERRDQIFARQLSDRVSVIDELSRFGGDVFLERIEHRITTGGRHAAIFGCERASSFGYGAWDFAHWDVSLWGF